MTTDTESRFYFCPTSLLQSKGVVGSAYDMEFAQEDLWSQPSEGSVEHHGESPDMNHGPDLLSAFWQYQSPLEFKLDILQAEAAGFARRKRSALRVPTPSRRVERHGACATTTTCLREPICQHPWRRRAWPTRELMSCGSARAGSATLPTKLQRKRCPVAAPPSVGCCASRQTASRRGERLRPTAGPAGRVVSTRRRDVCAARPTEHRQEETSIRRRGEAAAPAGEAHAGAEAPKATYRHETKRRGLIKGRLRVSGRYRSRSCEGDSGPSLRFCCGRQSFCAACAAGKYKAAATDC